MGSLESKKVGKASREKMDQLTIIEDRLTNEKPRIPLQHFAGPPAGRSGVVPSRVAPLLVKGGSERGKDSAKVGKRAYL
eukprot:TsM_000678500 transcript=TsM_000678500 gene=TsM_000678500